jgi:hypothetical protein
VHRSEVVVRGERLNKRIVPAVLATDCAIQGRESTFTLLTALNSSVARRPEHHVVVPLAQFAGRATVIVRSGDDPAVDFPNQITFHGAILRQ